MKTREAFLSVVAGLLVIVTPCFSQSAPSTQQQIAAHSLKAQEYLKENKPELAVPEFKALVALEPNNVDARGNLGVLLFFQGAYADAIPHLRAALKLQPSLWKIQALLGMAEKRTGNVDGALGDLETAFPKLTEQKIRVETGMELIEIYSKSGELEKAAVTVGVLRELEPTNVEIIYAAYRVYSDLADESKLSLSEVGASPPNDGP
jgi:tetratricopeptide (TPR) repeat protein